MKRTARSIMLSVVMLVFVLNSCNLNSGEPPVVPANPVSDINSNDFLNIQINAVEFSNSIGDTDGEGELQLIIIASDENGRSDALICPYGAVVKVRAGDIINPCKAGLSYPQNTIQDYLYVMFIALDIDDTGLVGDIGAGVLTTGLAVGLEKAVVAAGLVNPGSAPVVIGFLALDVVIGFAGTKVQEYFEKSDVIGSQSFILSRSSSWNNGKKIAANSVEGDVEFSFTVQVSSTAEGRVVGSTTEQNNDEPPPNTNESSTESSPPVIDSINFPKTIICDGRRYDVPVKFHDLDGDAHRIQWELLYTKKKTPLYSDAVEFYIESDEQKLGATFHDFLEWYISGDEVKIRVYIEDREKQSGFMDFEFKCSN